MVLKKWYLFHFETTKQKSDERHFRGQEMKVKGFIKNSKIIYNKFQTIYRNAGQMSFRKIIQKSRNVHTF